jgi:hypothetical protein
VGEFFHAIVFVLSAMGLTVLIVWPDKGPTAWLRDTIFRKLLPVKAQGVLDCYICLGFWIGLALEWPFWRIYHETWIWWGLLMIPVVFWLVMPGSRGTDAAESGDGRRDTAENLESKK